MCQIRRISSKSIKFTAFAEATLLSITEYQHSLTVRETFCLPFLLLIHFSKFEISEGTYITLKKNCVPTHSYCSVLVVPSGFQVLSRLYSIGSKIGKETTNKAMSFIQKAQDQELYKSLNHWAHHLPDDVRII